MSKPFSSKSLAHLSSYSAVGSVKSYALSFRSIQLLATYAIALANFTNNNIISKFPVVADLAAFIDSKFDTLVLGSVDSLLAHPSVKEAQASSLSVLKQASDQVDSLKAKVHDTATEYKKISEDTVSEYLKPVNEYASTTVDKLLPKAKDAAKKVEVAADKAEETTTNEIAKSIDIVHDTYERSKDLISSKSAELSHAVINTYNKEFEAAPEKNYIAKVATASVNTSVSLIKHVNNEFIDPFFDETSSKSEEEAGELSEKAKAVAKDASTKLNKATNGAIPVVEASA